MEGPDAQCYCTSALLGRAHDNGVRREALREQEGKCVREGSREGACKMGAGERIEGVLMAHV